MEAIKAAWHSIFPPPPTPTEILRASEKDIRKSIRLIEREKKRLENEERPILRDIKAKAQAGKHKEADLIAEDLIVRRNGVKQLLYAKVSLNKLLTNLRFNKTTAVMSTSLRNATIAMMNINASFCPKSTQKLMMHFQKQNALMEDQQELMNEAMEDVAGASDDSAEKKELINSIYDEIGIETTEQMKLPSIRNNNNSNAIDDDLMKKIENLKK
jgi:charged multivesicular body protein 2A